MRITIYILVLFSSINGFSQSKNKIQIINTDRLISGPVDSNYWICIGNVNFKNQETIMFCDSSYHYAKKEKVIAFGNIIIKKGDSLRITAKKLIYDKEKDIASIIGNVILKDNHTKLHTEQITLDLKTDIAYYNTKGSITEKETTIQSETGRYNTKTHKFYFQNNVIVESVNYIIETDTLNYNSINKTAFFLGPSNIFSENNTIYCENGWYNTKTNLSQFRKNAIISNKRYKIKGDSLFYDRNRGYGKAINNVTMLDKLKNIKIHGNLSEYFENEDSRIEVSDKSFINILFNQDSLLISANKFIRYNKNEYVLAHNNVKIFKEDLQARCDSLYYNTKDSIIHLYKNPVLWIDEIQITSDSMKISMINKTIDKMIFYVNPIIISKVDSLHFNQIKGQNIIAVFKENLLRKLNIIGDGESLFLISEADKNNIGINKAFSSNITIHIQEKKINNIIYKISPISNTIPYQEIKESDKYLSGFTWRINERPMNKEDIIQ